MICKECKGSGLYLYPTKCCRCNGEGTVSAMRQLLRITRLRYAWYFVVGKVAYFFVTRIQLPFKAWKKDWIDKNVVKSSTYTSIFIGDWHLQTDKDYYTVWGYDRKTRILWLGHLSIGRRIHHV